MQNTTKQKSSVYCFDAQGVLSLLVHLKYSFVGKKPLVRH